MQIAVIGAGIIGQTIALRLGQAGYAVTLIAPEVEPHMASTGNAGTIADYAVEPVGTPEVLRDTPRLLFDPLSPLALHRESLAPLAPWLARFLRQSLPAAAQRNRAALAPLVHDAATGWTALAESVGGQDLFQHRGALYLYDSAAAMDGARAMQARRQALGVDVELLDQAALEALEPGLPRGRFTGAARFPTTLWMTDPARMLDKIAAAARASRITARVTSLTQAGAGWRVTLDSGAVLDASRVVVAAGAWSARLLRPVGVRIPLISERGYHLEFDLPLADQPVTRPTCPVAQGFYFTPMDGRLRAAGTVELGRADAPASPHRWDVLERNARAIFPDLPPVSRRWMGNRPSLPDSLPAVGTARPGLLLAFGHGHIGLTLAPRTADMILRALDGGDLPPAVSPHRF